MANHKGVNGLEYRPEDIYRCTHEELVQRGSNGGTTSGRRKHYAVKWQRVKEAEAKLKSGELPWVVLADFFDTVYDCGYAACYNNRRRKQQDAQL
jgi:hypothetical protein